MQHFGHVPERPRVLIADDHNLVAQGIRSLLEERCEVIGIVGDGRQLLLEASQRKPDVVVMDINMPLLNGFEAVSRLKQSNPEAKIVFLTMNSNPNFVDAALDLGEVGYVLKSAAGSELLTAIFEVLQGKAYVTTRLRRKSENSRSGPLSAQENSQH